MNSFISRLPVAINDLADSSPEQITASSSERLRTERGQTTAEYALVLLGAAGIALLLLGWATQSGAIGTLFDAVLGGVVDKVK
jgi:Flp pilus assembly pilin Flp